MSPHLWLHNAQCLPVTVSFLRPLWTPQMRGGHLLHGSLTQVCSHIALASLSMHRSFLDQQRQAWGSQEFSEILGHKLLWALKTVAGDKSTLSSAGTQNIPLAGSQRLTLGRENRQGLRAWTAHLALQCRKFCWPGKTNFLPPTESCW